MSKIQLKFRPQAGARRRSGLLLPSAAHLRRKALQFTAGGAWTDKLLAGDRRNLRWFWIDGVFASASDAVANAYLVLFVLALGATRGQIGLMSALSSLSAAILLLPGATLAERLGRRKPVVLAGGGGVARIALLLLALLPLVLSPAGAAPLVVYAAIALSVARDAFGNLSIPAWTSMTADIVPLAWRGRYFSSRNIAMGVAAMVTTVLFGQLITAVGGPVGYQLALGLACAIGLVSTFSFARIEEPAPAAPSPRAAHGSTRLPVAQRLLAQTDFVAFCAVAALWNLSINVAGPFFNVYMVESLHASPGVVGALSVVSSLAALPGQRLFGALSDRWGPRRVQLLTGLIIPLLPLAWAFTRNAWHVVPINLAGGFLWAGYSLASFNFLLTLTPEDRRARYAALYQIVVMVTLAAGAALGGVIATHWGYVAIFLASAIGRTLAALLFLRFFPERAAAETPQPAGEALA